MGIGLKKGSVSVVRTAHSSQQNISFEASVCIACSCYWCYFKKFSSNTK